MKRMLVSALLALILAVVSGLALAQGTLKPGTSEGTLKAGETVAFSLEAASGDVFVISMSAEFDSYLEILDSTGSYIASDDDSGRGRDAVAVFIAPTSGTYTVNARSFDSSAEGAFTLNVSSEFATATAGSPTAVTIDGVTSTVFQFVSEGGVFSIVADSGGTVDTSLVLFDATGYRVDSADDSIGIDPAFQRVSLDAGTYYLVLAPYSEDVTGETTLRIEPTVMSILSAEPTTIVFNENLRDDTAQFDVEAGKTYLITVTLDVVDDFSMGLSSADETQFTYGNLSFTQGLGGTFLYVPDITGTIQADISGGFYSSSESVTYTITVVEAE